MKAILVAMIMSAAVCSGCTQNAGPSAVTFQYGTPKTLVSDGFNGDADLVGAKQVSIRMTFTEKRELLTTRLTYWPAGQNAQAETIEEMHNEVIDPPPGGTLRVRFEVIPDSEDLDLCEAMYYMWTVTHGPEGGGPAGVFVGQARLIQPAKKYVNGTIQQAQCAAPPGPGE